MENFDWTRFTRKIAVKSTLPRMYSAWTKASEIESWFLSNADFFEADGNKIDKTTEIEQDHTYAWQWYGYDGTETGKITEANGRDFIQFTFEGNCLVDVKLSQYKDMVLVELTQKNIPTDENSKRNIRLGCHAGWGFYMVNLKSVYEGGLDLRNMDNDLQGMINN